MKKYFSLIAALAAAVSFNSCNKEQDFREPQEKTDGYKYTFTIAEDETKATISETGVAWVAGDRVGMFLDGYTGYAEVDKTTTPTSVILYSPNAIAADTYAYAYYPYDSENSDKTLNHIYLANVQLGGSSSAMPLAGVPFKIENDYEAKEKPNGQIKFMNLGSVIDFKVFSSSFNSETIQYITFTATSKKDLNGDDTDLAVTGDGYLDLTGVSESSESSLELTFGLGTDYDYAKVNSLSVAVADSKANASSVYMVVAPGIYTGTITIGTDAATYTFNYTNKTLGRNEIKHYNMNLDNAARVAGVVETVESLPYSEPFATGIGEFETDGEQVASTDIWQFATGYGMKATAYVNKVNYESESWLVSPQINLEDVAAAELTFEQCVNKFMAAGDGTVWIKRVSDANYTQLANTYPTVNGTWSDFEEKTIEISEYAGNKVIIAFKYISTSSQAGTWEIKNFNVKEKVYTTEFTMGADAISVEVGKTKNNSVTVNSGATITYSSDDTDIATVAADGTVTGVAEGTTTINVHVDANGLYPAKDGSFDVTVTPAVSYSSFSWDLSVDETKTASENELSWDYRGVTMVVEKADATTNANNYYGANQSSTRFYKNSTFTITPYSGSTIGYVEFSATTEGYATAFAGSTWTNATASADGTTVTVTPTDGTAAFYATIGGTCGFTVVTVYYTGELKTVTKYTITVDGSIANGSVSASAATAEEGDIITLSATPATGYALSSYDVRDASSNEVTVTDNKFTMPASNVTVSATFAQLYTISTTADHGTITVTPSTSVVAGTEVTISASADSGYAFSSWTVTGDATPASTTESTTTFTMPAGNVSVTANYVVSATKTEQVLFHETFGNNTGSARAWSDTYSVKTGVSAVYSGISSYTVTNAKQSKNTGGSTQSGLNQSTQGTDAVLIIGPLNVSSAEDMVLTYQWKAASIKGTYSTSLYYATSSNGEYNEVAGTGSGATTFVERSYSLPAAAQVSTLYLKIIWNTSNTQAVIDEVDLTGKY